MKQYHAPVSITWAVRDSSASTPKRNISGATDAARILAPFLAQQSRELFVILPLDTRGKTSGIRLVSMGNLSSSLVHPREVFREALLAEAAAIIIAHNHPSGDAEPSGEDLAVTRKLVAAGKILGVPVMDHLIIGAVDRWVSLEQRGLIQSREDR